MLKQRILTALILIPLVVLAVYLMPVPYFVLLVGLIVLLAGWEWTTLVGINCWTGRILFQAGLILPMLGIYFWTYILEFAAQLTNFPEIRTQSGVIEWLVVLPVLFWLVVMVLIRNTPQAFLNLKVKLTYKGLIGWFILLSAWMFFYRLKAFYGADMAMYFLVLIWLADIAAYFTGKKYGDRKLAPEISPGKTLAGFYGALASAVVCAIVLSLIFEFHLIVLFDFALLSVLTVLVSVYGDLFISVVKRQGGFKDSGSLLPGHGGILDRIDSIIAAAPLFYSGIYLMGGQI
jgi:phosphatidate cytidylyltransferase